ncbi:MAG: hypothetical protein WC768_04225 [Patescibacteria group bacterium]
MNKKLKLVLSVSIFLLLLLGVFYYLWAQQPGSDQKINNPFDQSSHSSEGFGTNAARVDSQITLNIPQGKAQEVYDYLRNTYVKSNEKLSQAFPELNLKGEQRDDISIFTDDYFDTASLDLYKNNNSARHRLRINTTDPTDAKSGRELVQIKVTPPGQFDTRTELKFQTQAIDQSSNDFNDRIAPIGFVASNQRTDFKNSFNAIKVDPYQLRHILTNTQKRSRVYLDWDGTNFFSFSVDEGSTNLLWAKANITSIDLGLVENVYTEADSAKRKTLEDIRNFLLQDLKEHFPELTENSLEKYVILLDELAKQIPYLKFFIRIGLL